MNGNRKILYVQLAWEELNDSDEESSDDEEVLSVLRHKSGNFFKGRSRRIHLYMENVVFKYNSSEFQSHFRVTTECFDVLMHYLYPTLERQGQVGRKTIRPQKQLLAVLWLLASPDSFRSVGDRFDMAKSSLSVVFTRVIKAINKLSKRVIKWPTNGDILNIQREFCRVAGVPFVVGAVDGTYIPIKAPLKDSDVYIARKCHYAITLQAICIPSLKFTDIFVGYPGSVSDTRIFKNSDIYKSIQYNREGYLPNNSIILGDKAYPVLEWVVPPYIDKGNLTNNQRRFNHKHAQTRQVIERAFALLFGRFRRLKFLDINKIEMIPHTVLAACILHNICLDHSDLGREELIQEGLNEVDGNPNVDDENANELGQIRRNTLLNDIFVI